MVDLKKEYVTEFVKKITGMAGQAGFKVSFTDNRLVRIRA